MTFRTRLAVFALIVAAAACQRARPHAGSRIAIGLLTSATTLDPHLQGRRAELPRRSITSTTSSWPSARRCRSFRDSRFAGRTCPIPNGAFICAAAWCSTTAVPSARRTFAPRSCAQKLPGSMVGYYVQSIREVRVVDDATIVLLTRDPSPVLLNKLVFIAIVPRSARRRRSIARSEPDRTRSSRAAPGSGSRGPGSRRSGARHRSSSACRSFRFRAGRTAPPRSPQVAWTRSAVSPRNSGEGRRSRRRCDSSPGRISEVLLGFSERPGSPFADPALRRAMASALDRREIAARGLKGLAVPLDQLVPSTVFGYSSRLPPLPTIRRKPGGPPDLRERRGPADGDRSFPTTLHGAADEIVRRTGALGLRVTPVELPFASFNARWARGDAPLVLFGWERGTPATRRILRRLCIPRERIRTVPITSVTRAPRWTASIEQSDRILDPAARLETLTKAQGSSGRTCRSSRSLCDSISTRSAGADMDAAPGSAAASLRIFASRSRRSSEAADGGESPTGARRHVVGNASCRRSRVSREECNGQILVEVGLCAAARSDARAAILRKGPGKPPGWMTRPPRLNSIRCTDARMSPSLRGCQASLAIDGIVVVVDVQRDPDEVVHQRSLDFLKGVAARALTPASPRSPRSPGPRRDSCSRRSCGSRKCRAGSSEWRALSRMSLMSP